jgi:cytoskeleton protein RodZ
MSSVGETLRRERMRQNLDLEQISLELKISSRFLTAIEDNRFDRLPAGVFAKSFVRQYARFLGVDEDQMAAEVQRAIAPPSIPTNAAQPSVPPIPEIHAPRIDNWGSVGDRGHFQWSSTAPALALVVVVMLVCSGVYAFWQRARQPVATAQTVAPAATPPAQAGSAPAQQAPVQPEPAAGTQAPAPTGAPAAQVTPNPAPNPPPTPANSADRHSNGPVHIELAADEPVWVLARADGKFLFSGTLDTNQSREVDANEVLTLRLGNAGGVSIKLNGKDIGPVGPKGQVREVQFTSGGFQIVAAPKPSLPEDNPI